MKILIGILSFIILFGACSCNKKTSQKHEPQDLKTLEKEYKEPMMKWNHDKIREQDFMIQKYAERRNWNMTRTESGLFYNIFENGNGMPADSGLIAVFDYKLNLLDGKFCYSSDSTGPRQLRLGKAEIESGLEEALLQMRIGDKAHVIIPPHLGYGMPGDGNKIPPDAILVYNIELKELY